MNKFKVTVYKNNTILMKRKNTVNTFANCVKKDYWIRKIVNEEYPYLSKQLYKKALNRHFYKLHELEVNADNCVFLTLGTSNTMTFNEINNEFLRFAKSFKYKYNYKNYIKAVECYENGFDRYHIHSIFIFESEKPTLNREWLKKHWVFGEVFIEHLYKDYEDGLLNYICSYDKNCIQKNQEDFTKYPQFAKFITASHNIEKKQVLNEFECDKDFMSGILKSVNEIDYNAKINFETHLYNNQQCLDGCSIYNAKNLTKILNDANENK